MSQSLFLPNTEAKLVLEPVSNGWVVHEQHSHSDNRSWIYANYADLAEFIAEWASGRWEVESK